MYDYCCVLAALKPDCIAGRIPQLQLQFLRIKKHSPELHNSLQSPAAMKELGGEAAQARLHQRACLVAN
jgi:hypothetical protein